METAKLIRDDLAMAERFGVLANRILGFRSEEYQRPGECAIAELTAIVPLPSGEELEEGKFFFAFEDGECREWWTDDTTWKPHLLTGLSDMLQVVEVESEIGSFWRRESEVSDG